MSDEINRLQEEVDSANLDLRWVADEAAFDRDCLAEALARIDELKEELSATRAELTRVRQSWQAERAENRDLRRKLEELRGEIRKSIASVVMAA